MDAKFRSDQEKLPKLYKEPSNNFSNCLVPLTDYNGKGNQFINMHLYKKPGNLIFLLCFKMTKQAEISQISLANVYQTI